VGSDQVGRAQQSRSSHHRIVASVTLAFAAMAVADRLDTAFHTVNELRAFASVPGLVTIRMIPTKARAAPALPAGAHDCIRRGRADLIVARTRHVPAGNEAIVRRTSGALR
jgi:hypothetical protein